MRERISRAGARVETKDGRPSPDQEGASWLREFAKMVWAKRYLGWRDHLIPKLHPGIHRTPCYGCATSRGLPGNSQTTWQHGQLHNSPTTRAVPNECSVPGHIRALHNRLLPVRGSHTAWNQPRSPAPALSTLKAAFLYPSSSSHPWPSRYPDKQISEILTKQEFGGGETKGR